MDLTQHNPLTGEPQVGEVYWLQFYQRDHKPQSYLWLITFKGKEEKSGISLCMSIKNYIEKCPLFSSSFKTDPWKMFIPTEMEKEWLTHCHKIGKFVEFSEYCYDENPIPLLFN